MFDKEARKEQILSILTCSQEELTQYATLKDETLRIQAAEKIWMAFHKLLELVAGKKIHTGEIWKYVRAIDDSEITEIAGAAGALHNYHYTWEEYGPVMERDFAYSHDAIKKRLAAC